MYLDIKKFYTREQVKAMFFGYMNCIRFNMPTTTLENGVRNFMKYHKIDEEVFNPASALQEYRRMAAEYIELEKSE